MKVKIRIRRTKEHEIGHIPLLIFIIIVFGIFLTLCFLSKDKAEAEEKAKEPPSKIEVDKSPPPLKETVKTIKKGETLSDILSRQGFFPPEIHKLRTEVKPVYDLAKIKEGQ